ncbi:hypothetical protein AYI70_g6151 [Smittium culicis]|uniref:Uncharacterized protein n=1 Tax=Smittium culicis TaxID=133412 RepID=A0A1R1XRF1_9FUNG|nr:hypothetical protein AYI70_g6151 [Smittium culicis]
MYPLSSDQTPIDLRISSAILKKLQDIVINSSDTDEYFIGFLIGLIDTNLDCTILDRLDKGTFNNGIKVPFLHNKNETAVPVFIKNSKASHFIFDKTTFIAKPIINSRNELNLEYSGDIQTSDGL